MKNQPPKLMTPFDELVNPSFTYTLKLLLPYLPVSMQRVCAILLKFFELRYTLDTFYGFTNSHFLFSSDSLFQDLKPYMPPEDQEMMEQFSSMMHMMEVMKTMQNQDSFSSAENTGNFSPFDMLKGMMDPSQQEMFETYSNMFDHTINKETMQKGADHERMDQSPGTKDNGSR